MIHILDAPDTFEGVKYIFWLSIAIIVGAIPISLLLLQWSSRLDSLGLASMFVETAVLSLSLARLGMGRGWMRRR